VVETHSLNPGFDFEFLDWFEGMSVEVVRLLSWSTCSFDELGWIVKFIGNIILVENFCSDVIFLTLY
jgi:hypothetical protein